MKVFTTKQAQRQFNALLDATEHGPATILWHGRPRAVILSASQWRLYEGLARLEAANRAARLLESASAGIVNGIAGGAVTTGDQERRLASAYAAIAATPSYAPKTRLARRGRDASLLFSSDQGAPPGNGAPFDAGTSTGTSAGASEAAKRQLDGAGVAGLPQLQDQDLIAASEAELRAGTAPGPGTASGAATGAGRRRRRKRRQLGQNDLGQNKSGQNRTRSAG